MGYHSQDKIQKWNISRRKYYCHECKKHTLRIVINDNGMYEGECLEGHEIKDQRMLKSLVNTNNYDGEFSDIETEGFSI
jgi:hypothetical protein